jgi:hypothetical protein
LRNESCAGGQLLREQSLQAGKPVKRAVNTTAHFQIAQTASPLETRMSVTTGKVHGRKTECASMGAQAVRLSIVKLVRAKSNGLQNCLYMRASRRIQKLDT